MQINGLQMQKLQDIKQVQRLQQGLSFNLQDDDIIHDTDM